jgi:hypothetical protein
MAPIHETINPNSDLVGIEFSEEFKARIRAHHTSHPSPLGTVSFENALRLACKAQGMEAELAPSRTTRFWDILIDGEKWSAKSTAAQGIKPDEIHISKLCEAAWIQDCRTAAQRHERALQLFDDFLSVVHRWIVLRAIRDKKTGKVWYELVEIPMSIFAKVKILKIADFASENTKIDVVDENGIALQLVLDRSDSKITIKKIPKSRCIVHAEWTYTPA